jgi:Pectate lyase superfamily protein
MAITTKTISDLMSLTFTPNVNEIYYTTDIGQEGEWHYSVEPVVDDINPSTIYNQINTNNIGTVISSNIAGSSPPQRHVFRRVYDGYVNVKWFGAKGDGFTIDNVAIQNALDYISTINPTKIFGSQKWTYGGGTLFFPAGRYRINETLKVSAHTRMLGVTRGGQYNPAGGYPYTYPNFTGSVIAFSLEADKENWVIETACYYASTGNTLGKYDVVTAIDIDSAEINQSSGIVIEDLIIDGCQYYWPPSGEIQALLGGIKLSASINAVIRNVTVVNVNIGIMLNASWSASIENVRIFSRYYGTVLYNNSFTKFSSCYISGTRLQDLQRDDIPYYEALIGDDFFKSKTDLPKAFYNQLDYTSTANDFGFDDPTQIDIVKRGKTGIWISYSGSVCLVNTIVEYYTNGITEMLSAISLDTCYLEGNRYASLIVAGRIPPTAFMPSYPTGIIANGLSLSTVGDNITAKDVGITGAGFGFYFGNHVLASLNGVGQYSDYAHSELFYGNEGTNRNIVFSKSIHKNRVYKKDIQFIDEGVNGQNLGSVYIDPIDGKDFNYGFNENDALATFDEALVRVQNQSTLNPVKKIQLKRGTTTSKLPFPIEIENADVLISSYGTGAKPILLYEVGGTTNNTGYILLGSNVKLTFKEVDIDVSNTAVLPSAFGCDVSFFCLKDNFGQLHFEDLSINLQTDYVLLSNYVSGAGVVSFCLFETKMVKVDIVDNLTAVSGTALLCNSTNPMTIDCKQIRSRITPAMASKPNRGWDVGNVIYNNL